MSLMPDMVFYCKLYWKTKAMLPKIIQQLYVDTRDP